MKKNPTNEPIVFSAQGFDPLASASHFYIIDADDKPWVTGDGDRLVLTMDEAARVIEDWKQTRTKPPAITDIFQRASKFNVTQTSYIVAPGVNGAEYYKQIPPEAFTVVVNKAINCPVEADLWLVADSECPKQGWWRDGYSNHGSKLCLASTFNISGVESPYTFRIPDPPVQISAGDGRIYPGELRTGGTITAMAIQLVAQLGAERIVLIGVDMHGDIYYDNTKNKMYSDLRAGKDWESIVPRINSLIEHLSEQHVSVVSLSDTALNVKKVRPATVSGKCYGRDILKSKFRFTDDVYIVATGPSGRAHYKDIPPDADVIVVNQAIDIQGIPKSIWMCEHSTLSEHKWFRDAAERHCGRLNTERGLRNKNKVVPVFMDDPELNQYKTTFCFKHHGFLGGTNLDGKVWPGQTFGGATISCRAMQIAYQLGARRIILIGVDMAGDDYFDGGKGNPKYAERRDGGKWTQRKAMDTVIHWIETHSDVELSSLSDTALRIPIRRPWPPASSKRVLAGQRLPVPAREPTIAYLSMCIDPRATINIAAWCLAQDYPNELKTLYLVHQTPAPNPLDHQLPLKIRELCVDKPWPDAWAFKFKEFVDKATEDIMILFDQDDCWLPDYTRKAIEPLLAGAKMAWNYDMYHVQNKYKKGDSFPVTQYGDKLPKGGKWVPTVHRFRHQSPIGTFCGWLDRVREIYGKFMEEYPRGLKWHGAKRGWGGPIDNYFKLMLMHDYAEEMAEHEGMRVYFIHTGASSKYHRRKEGFIDHGT